MNQTSDDRKLKCDRNTISRMASGEPLTKTDQASNGQLERRGELVLFQQVVLCRDCPDQQLTIGDEATLLDFIPHPDGGEEGCILEIFGEDLGRVAIVPISAIGVLRLSDE